MANISTNRIISIDVFRGLTMFLLIAEFTGLMNLLTNKQFEGIFFYSLAEQFHHHPWNGLRFWDLVQPFFMFIVGLSLPFSILARQKKGENNNTIFYHTLIRSAKLLFFGWALYCIAAGEITFYFQNVLAQIAVTYLIAYLIMNKSIRFQLIVSFLLIIITELFYRCFSVEGFNNPFVIMENFGTWIDTQYGGVSSDGWVSINAIPTVAHTIWGVLIGKLLISKKSLHTKLKIMLFSGILLILVGYLMDSITPIIKRISTSSFVIVSGGWSILFLAFLFWIIDFLKFKGKWVTFFTVISMNSLFIYLFSHVGGADFVEFVLHPFTYSIFNMQNPIFTEIITSTFVLISLWFICYWMYKKKLFIKI